MIYEKVGETGMQGETQYLSHQAVVRQERKRSKCGKFLKSQQKQNENVSLNAFGYAGPSLLCTIFDIFLEIWLI